MSRAVAFSGPAALHREFSAPLTAIERAVFDFCERAAREGRPLEPTETIMEAIGATGSATIPGILKRLERKGYISRTIYQRGRKVCITATGQCTLPPNDTSPHWRLRDRSQDAPAPAIQQTRQRDLSLFAMIEQAARAEGKPITEFLVDLVYIGWHGFSAEREAEA